jgi:YHS domain-containing protein
MKKLFLTMLLSVGLIVQAYAAEEAALVQVPNKICPVSGHMVGTEGMVPHQVTHNGKAYNLCCAMCAKDFNKDPEKYVKMMEDEVSEQE